MIISVAMLSLLLMMMINVVRGTSLVDEAHDYLTFNSITFDKANELAKELAKPDAYYIGSNKEHLIEQIRARISMTQPNIDELAQLYVAKFGDTAKRFNSSEEFDPDDQEKAKQLVDKLKESSMWFRNLFRPFVYQDELKDYYSKVEANEKLLQDGFDMLTSSPKIEHKRPYLDGIRMELNKVKPALDKVKSFFVHQLDTLNADVVDHDVFIRYLRDKIYSDYNIALDNMNTNLTKQCQMLREELNDELLLAESVKDDSDKEKPQDDEKTKQNSASISASNPSGSKEKQEDPPADIPNTGNQSTQEDNRPFWKKKRYYIPAGAVAGAGILFTGWLLDLQNIIPQMIGWGSKEDYASTKVNPPNSTTTDTSTDATTHQVEYLTVVIIVLVVLVLLAVGFVVLLKGYKNGTSDLELGKPSHKSQAASTMTSTGTGTETPLTPTRSTNTTSCKAKSKKDSPGTASSPASTKTKSKRSSQK